MIKNNLFKSVCLCLSTSVAPVFFISCSSSINHHQVKEPSVLLSEVLSGKKQANHITTKETVEIFKECVEISKPNIEKLQSQQGQYKKAIAVIGNTGSGKSTIINYLHGCKMGWVDNAKGEMIIDVIEGGSVYAELGHSSKSMTFLPGVSISKETSIAYIDCPGFFDSRGAGVNIANSLNVKQMLEITKDLSLIFIIDYDSLQAGRATGLKEMMTQVKAFFGSEKEIVKNKDSLMLIVSKVDSRLRKFNSLDAIVTKAIESLKAEGSDILEHLKNRFFSYDPTEHPIKGGSERYELLDHIHQLQPIKGHENLFNSTLTNEDQIALERMCDEISKNIVEILKCPIEKLKYEHFVAVSENFKLIDSFEFIKNEKIDNCIDKAKNIIISSLQHIIDELKLKCHKGEFDSTGAFLLILDMCDKTELFSFDLSGELKADDLKQYSKQLKEQLEKAKKEDEKFNKMVELLSSSINSTNSMIAKLAENLNKQPVIKETYIEKPRKGIFGWGNALGFL